MFLRCFNYYCHITIIHCSVTYRGPVTWFSSTKPCNVKQDKSYINACDVCKLPPSSYLGGVVNSGIVRPIIMPILAWLTSQRGAKITRMSTKISITFSPYSGLYTSEVDFYLL